MLLLYTFCCYITKTELAIVLELLINSIRKNISN